MYIPQKLRIGNSTDFTKVYSQKTLMNGIHMLHGKDIYAALGNHNVGGPMLKNTTRSQLNGLCQIDITQLIFLIISLVVIDSNLS